MGANYTYPEVARMVVNYANLQAIADTDRKGMRLLLLAADLEQAMDQLDEYAYAVVLLVGVLGLPQREVARLLITSQPSISRVYADALDDLHFYINGG